MTEEYRNTTIEMEKQGVNQDYIIGWQCGYLGHPKREEQRSTDAYDAGYNDGEGRKTDGFSSWTN